MPDPSASDRATQRGRCLCGAVTYEFTGEPAWRGHCHCESCRRNCSAPFTTFLGVPREGFRWTGAAPQVYDSSPGVRRPFCGRCGSPMAYDAAKDRANIHLYAASLAIALIDDFKCRIENWLPHVFVQYLATREDNSTAFLSKTSVTRRIGRIKEGHSIWKICQDSWKC